MLNINAHISLLDKDYNELKLQYNKQSGEEFIIQRAVKTTIQRLYDKGSFDIYSNADENLEHFFFTTRRGLELEKVNNIVH